MYPDSKLQLSYESKDAVYFFSHAFDPLNNWSGHRVVIWGEAFPTLEHGYHYQKYAAVVPSIAAEIKAAPSAWAAMQLDRQYRAQRRNDWEKVKVGIMDELLRAKVEQNEDVRSCLLATGTKRLIENSPWDEFWGSGARGVGKNTVGELLMAIREELKPSVTD